MFTRIPLALVLALLVISLAMPHVARAQANTASTTGTAGATTSPAPAKTTVKKKTTTHKTKKHKTSSKTVTKKTASKKPKETLLAAVPAPNGEGSAVVPAPKARSLSQMGQPPKAGAAAGEVVRSFYTNLTETMKQGDSLGFEGRQKRLQPSIDRSFNMDEMMRVAAGPSWSSATPAQQKEMIRAFRAFSVANYANRFPHYAGEKFEVVGEKPGRNANERIVETSLTTSDDKTDLNYLMRRDGKGSWKIVDVYVNGTISEMATRRSEFGSVLRQQGVDAFLQLLDAKSHELGNS